MRVIVQRVSEAKVEIEDVISGSIKQGLLIFAGFVSEDTQEDINWTANKLVQLRIFSDATGAMNKSLLEIDGNMLIVSQFTLHAKTKKGNRPSFLSAAPPEIAIPLYESFVKKCNELLPSNVQTGIFGADMKVALCNDGPVTIIIDSKNRDL